MRNWLILLAVFCLGCFSTQAAHILGGEISYQHVSGTTYRVTLILYLECGGIDETSARIAAYPAANPNGGGEIVKTAPRTFAGNVDQTYIFDPCLQPPPAACLRKRIFETNFNLSSGTGGWIIVHENTARSGGLINIVTPSNTASAYTVIVPDPMAASWPGGGPNNSPYFPNDPPPNLCINDSIYYDHSAFDADGDSVVYFLCTPKGQNPGNPIVYTPPPYPDIVWAGGYNANYPIDANPPFTVDRQTGFMSGQPNALGYYVWSVCYEEYRNGTLINQGSRDYVFRVTNCGPNFPSANVQAQGTATTDGWCGGLQVDFQNQSVNGLYYLWDFGDGTTSIDENPTHIYNSPGTYTVWLYVNPGTPCVDSSSQVFQVYPTTDASWTPPAAQCFTDNAFDFEPDTVIPNNTFLWDFGPNATPQFSNDPRPDSVVFNAPGTYTVTLEVSNTTCSDIVSHTVDVLPSPIVSFQAPSPQCVNNNSFFFVGNGNFDPGSTYAWDFGPNATPLTATTKNVSNVSFNTTGYQVVSFTGVNSSGCSETYTDSVLITPPPTASFAPPDTQCQNVSSYNFINTGTYGSAATFTWTFPQGSPPSATTENVLDVHFLQSGTHTVTLQVSEYGCTDTYTQDIVVADAPFAFVHPIANQCFDTQNFNFDGDGIYSSSASFLWDFGPNGTPGSATTIDVNGVTFDTLGSQDVFFMISENGCTDTFALQVDVTPKPTASFAQMGTRCISDGPFDFVNLGSYGPDATFFWDFDGATPPTSTNADELGVVWANPGTYTVSLTVSENGCDTTFSETFTLTPAPAASYAPVAAQCVGTNSFDFTNTGTYGAGASFQWDFGANATPPISSLENPTGIVYSAPGLYPVSLSITENNCTDVFVDTIYVSDIPAPNFVRPADQCVEVNSYDFTAAGTFGQDAVFTWNFANAAPAVSNAQNPTGVVFSASGWQTVSLTIDENGCSTLYTDSVNVTPAPTPFFTRPNQGCITNNLYTFSAQGGFGPAATFVWSFPSASPDSAFVQNPSGVVFGAIGNHPVTLTISENGCTYSYVDTVRITPEPIAQTDSLGPQCLTINTYDFIGQGSFGDSATFAWDFGGNATPLSATGKDVLGVQFTSVGTHTVNYTISENGCADTYTLQIEITAPPGADFMPNAAQCLDVNNFNFQTLGLYGPASTFAWDFGPNASPASSTLENPQGVVFNATGWQTISLTVDENGCPATFIDSVLVTPKPVASFPAMPNQCLSINSYDFIQDGASGSDATYSWNFGAIASPSTSTLENPTGVSFNTAGNHTVTLTISENGCVETYTDVVVVTPEPVANYLLPDGECVDINSFDFFAAGTFGSDAVFTWDFGPNASPTSSNLANPSGVSYADSGYYPVSLTIDENGCSSTFVDTVIVYPIPVIDFDTIPNGCAPYTIQFTNTSFAWTPMSYLWDFGDGNTSALPNPSHTYQLPGTYDVSLTATSASGCIGTFNKTVNAFVTAYPNPVANVRMEPGDTVTIFSPEMTIVDLSQGAITQTAFLSNGDYLPYMPYVYTFTDTGNYILTQIVENEFGCTDTLESLIRVDAEFQFFAPNSFTPNEDGINDRYIQKGYGIQDYTLQIYTRWGERVYETNDLYLGWDGIHQEKNEPAANDTYAWSVKIIDVFGIPHEYRGEVILIR